MTNKNCGYGAITLTYILTYEPEELGLPANVSYEEFERTLETLAEQHILVIRQSAQIRPADVEIDIDTYEEEAADLVQGEQTR